MTGAARRIPSTVVAVLTDDTSRQNARAQSQPAPGVDVVGERDLVVGAAAEAVHGLRMERGRCEGLEAPPVDHRRSPPVGGGEDKATDVMP